MNSLSTCVDALKDGLNELLDGSRSSRHGPKLTKGRATIQLFPYTTQSRQIWTTR